ncbi:FAD-dependent oxidoreductase [Caballeronia sp. GACF4]|uniref:FAD-dependent oxidoreductase n=1 Tax=Caballeronia sp. GACF4 TaxID=2921763 RepID=UPI002028C9BA|nr:FAD-dependent oxidoreductase [Caballeronia sp. GACF4]
MRINLGLLQERHFDVAVIGAGINGASAAQHLAAAGYRVAMVDKGDYGSAASSRSSRILHSGLRYFAPKRSLWEHLAHPLRFFELAGTAFQSMAAMGELIATIPDKLKPLSLTMPIYKDTPYRGWHVDLGVLALRLSKLGRVPLTYRRTRNDGSKRDRPGDWLRDQSSITHFARFSDFTFVWPERITIDAVMDARRLGATVRNYTKVERLWRAPDGKWQLSLRDCLDPTQHAQLSASVVINAAGVWMDDLHRGVAAGAARRRVIGIKGSHILVRMPSDFANEGIAAMNRENEAIFCLPAGEFHYIGPTETMYEGDIDRVVPEEDEIRFLLDEANHLMPGLGLTREHVISAWAGVRPMTFDPLYPKGKRLPFSVLHDMASDGMPNLLALTWGTFNLHRHSARKIVAAVRRRIRSTGPKQTPIYSTALRTEVANDTTRAGELTPAARSLLRAILRDEDVTSLIDLVCRRTPLGWNPELTGPVITQVARLAMDALNWDEARVREEVAGLTDYLNAQHLRRMAPVALTV